MKSANGSNTMSAVTCGIMLLASTAFCAMIGDFAPTTVGAKWVYSYYYNHDDIVGNIFEWDSLTVSITISSKFIRGKDTVFVLGVSEQGRKFSNYNAQRINTDTTGTWNYTDTAIASGDSIVYNGSYRCHIFPFYKYHTITQDSLKKVLLDNDSIYCYGDSNYPNYYYYYQNIGYFSFDFEMEFSGIWIHKAKLIFFSNGNISVATKPFVSKPTARSAVSYRHAVIILDGKQMRNNGIYYDVRGKRISAGKNLYHGILLEKIGNP
jgi:hypothetical protein